MAPAPPSSSRETTQVACTVFSDFQHLTSLHLPRFSGGISGTCRCQWRPPRSTVGGTNVFTLREQKLGGVKLEIRMRSECRHTSNKAEKLKASKLHTTRPCHRTHVYTTGVIPARARAAHTYVSGRAWCSSSATTVSQGRPALPCASVESFRAYAPPPPSDNSCAGRSGLVCAIEHSVSMYYPRRADSCRNEHDPPRSKPPIKKVRWFQTTT